MRILILGSGGREHAMAWQIQHHNNESNNHQVFVAPGNPGTMACGTNTGIGVSDFEALGNFCIEQGIDMVIAGPEEPLVKGAWDYFTQTKSLSHIHFIGPSQFGAQLEGSKSFAKAFMQRHNIPTATYNEFTAETFEEGVAYLRNHSLPIVLKADGLAGGKGVIICESHELAIEEFGEMIQQSKFGEAGKKVVVEQFLSGIEMSVFVLTDGKEYVQLPSAKDYKRIGEQDSGLNTGGMGAVSPVPFADHTFMHKVRTKIIEPTVAGLHKENIAYTGFIFFGLIKVKEEPYVIEYNCRMGDPETEVVLPRLKTNLAHLCLAAAENRLKDITTETDDRTAVTIVAVSGGYPGNFEKGFKIELPALQNNSDTIIFQAGTKMHNENIVTSGGRVLCVTSYGEDIKDAVSKSMAVLQQVNFRDMYYRRDIGYEFV